MLIENSAVPLSPVNSALASRTNYQSFYASLNGESPAEEAEEPQEVSRRTFVEFPDRRPTLIVAPLSVLSNWIDQIETHLGPGCAAVLLYHGSKKVKSEVGAFSLSPFSFFLTKKKSVLSRQDVVITTYGTAHTEFGHSVKGLLSKIKWRRVILDEAHFIR